MDQRKKSIVVNVDEAQQQLEKLVTMVGRGHHVMLIRDGIECAMLRPLTKDKKAQLSA